MCVRACVWTPEGLVTEGRIQPNLTHPMYLSIYGLIYLIFVVLLLSLLPPPASPPSPQHYLLCLFFGKNKTKKKKKKKRKCYHNKL